MLGMAIPQNYFLLLGTAGHLHRSSLESIYLQCVQNLIMWIKLHKPKKTNTKYMTITVTYFHAHQSNKANLAK